MDLLIISRKYIKIERRNNSRYIVFNIDECKVFKDEHRKKFVKSIIELKENNKEGELKLINRLEELLSNTLKLKVRINTEKNSQTLERKKIK